MAGVEGQEGEQGRNQRNHEGCEKWGAEPPRIQLIMKDMGRYLRNFPHEPKSGQL